MKIRLDQHDGALFISLDAETMRDATDILTLCQKQLSPNTGRAWAANGVVAGWIRMPISKVPVPSVHSGNRKY